MGKNIKMENGPIRKRGRPSGKHRTPLSMAERRARNAQYERERRAENAEAMAELAETMGVDSTKVQSHELIDAVIRYIQQDRESVDSLKSLNRKLKMQIKSCEERLKPAAPALEQFLPETPSPEPNSDFPMAAINYAHAFTSVQSLQERLNPAPVKEAFWPASPAAGPSNNVPLSAINHTHALSSVESLQGRFNPAPVREEFWPTTLPTDTSTADVPSTAMNYAHAFTSVPSSQERFYPASVKGEFWPTASPTVPSAANVPLTAMHYTNGSTPHPYSTPAVLTPGTFPGDTEIHGYSNMELTPPNTQENIQTDGEELDFDFLLEYLER